MILQGARDDLGRGSRIPVHQHHDGIIVPVIAVLGDIGFLGLRATAMGHHRLSLLQELIGHRHAFVQQAARIVAQIEDQTMDIALAQRLKVVLQFAAGGLVELLDRDVGDTRPEPDSFTHAVARDFVARHRERKGLLAAFARDHDSDLRAPRTLQQIGHFGGGQVIGGLVVHLHDDIARPQARLVRRGGGERRHDNGFAVERAHLHADAEIVALLVLAEELVIARIEEIRMWIEGAEHPRNGALVDGLVGIDGFGKILFHQSIDAGKRFQAGADLVTLAIGGGGRRLDLRSIDSAHN